MHGVEPPPPGQEEVQEGEVLQLRRVRQPLGLAVQHGPDAEEVSQLQVRGPPDRGLPDIAAGEEEDRQEGTRGLQPETQPKVREIVNFFTFDTTTYKQYYINIFSFCNNITKKSPTFLV